MNATHPPLFPTAAALTALALVMTMLGCTNDGPRLRETPVGDGTLVVLERGSLTDERPTDDISRARALGDYLREQQERFGLGTVDPAAIDFTPAVEPEAVTDEGGETYHLVALHQMHEGAAVIDEIQMAAFAEAPEGDELRRVLARLRDPAALPTPPSPAQRDAVFPVVDALIADFDLVADYTTVGTEPVISARFGVAGFRVSQFVPSPDGGFDRFEAIADPVAGTYVVLGDQPPCVRAPLDPNLTLGEGPSFTFDPSTGPIGRSIRIHAVRLMDADDGNLAPITRAQVRRWVLAANTVWFPETGIRFEFDDSASSEDFESWKATRLNTLPANEDEHATYRAVGNVWALLFHHDKLVVFFRANGGYGFSWGPTSTFFVSMPSYTDTGIYKPDDGGVLPNDTLLSHEIGHYMGLAHTFSDAACGDAVPANSDGDWDGQDPETNADDVGDTAPDMTDKCYATDSLTCAGGSITFNGVSWSPPWNNVMSYHDCMPEAFSDDQVRVIDLTLAHPVRANLVH